jgi:DnaK suppressor protein
MKKTELNYFRELLLGWQNSLQRRAGDAIADLLDCSVCASDQLDQTTLELDRDITIRMRDRESKLIRKIKDALGRIEDGSYGICEMCGEQIALARLKARPVASLCIDCKRVLETLENTMA